MKKIIKLMVILWLMVAAAVLCCACLSKTDEGLRIDVIANPVQKQAQATPALDIHFAIVDQELEEWHETLEVVDSVVYIPEEIVVEQQEEEIERVIQEYIEDESIYEEKVLMDVKKENEVYEEEPRRIEESIIEYDGAEEIYQETETEGSEDEAWYQRGIIEDEYDDEGFESDFVAVVEYQEEDRENADVVMTNGTLGQQIVDYARSWVGVTPYVSWYDRIEDGYITNSLESGTDCSGFVSLIYDTFGVVTSASSDDYQYMSNIDYEDLEPGDIVVYRDGGHVGIYAGDDTIIHCANEDAGTIESDMWYQDPTGYVRIEEWE